MTFDSTVNLEGLVAIVVPLVGVITLWATSRERLSQLWKHVEEQERQHEENQKRLGALELQMEREFVKKDDLTAVERRIREEFRTSFHDLKQVLQTWSGVLGDRARRAREQD